jgi:hypothetical protein
MFVVLGRDLVDQAAPAVPINDDPILGDNADLLLTILSQVGHSLPVAVHLRIPQEISDDLFIGWELRIKASELALKGFYHTEDTPVIFIKNEMI